jgi:hypothetical protein
MSQFLWVEDFSEMNPDHINTAIGNLFKDIVDPENIPHQKPPLRKWFKENRVIITYNFLESLEFIRNPEILKQIDFVILDINLPVKDDLEDHNNYLMEFYSWHGYDESLSSAESEKIKKNAQTELKTQAGYHVFIELIQKLGFPKDHILICTNHGEELKSWNEAFTSAKIKPPELFDKENEKANQWIKDYFYNPYHVLRRGILECCQNTKQKLREKKIDIIFQDLFKDKRSKLSPDEMINFLETIEFFLPLKEPNTEEKHRLFRLLIRTISQDWDKVDSKLITDRYEKYEKEKLASARITKMTRNWSSHTNCFSELNERQVTFFLLTAMRSMFGYDNKPEIHELLLFRLFEKQTIGAKELKKKFNTGSHPLAQSYVNLKKRMKYKKYVQKIQFGEMLNDLQRSKNIKNKEVGRHCFQMFWHNLFPISIDTVNITNTNGGNKKGVGVHYSFQNITSNYFENKDNSFFFQFARRIYKDSFE